MPAFSTWMISSAISAGGFGDFGECCLRFVDVGGFAVDADTVAFWGELEAGVDAAG